jgi:hypothetical protein
VPAPPEAGSDAGWAASAVDPVEVDGDGDEGAVEVGPAELDDALGDADVDEGSGDGDRLGPGEAAAAVPGPAAVVVVRGSLVVPDPVVVRGADVVDAGVEVRFGVEAGAAGVDVVAAGGGALRGCCPEPNRKPTTLPAGGS